MTLLVTGSTGHLGEATMRTVAAGQTQAKGIDIQPSPYTHQVGSITDRDFVRSQMQGIEAVIHTATLHKPHVATHSRQDFVDTNITGTLTLLEEAARAGVRAFVFTSTTSTFGHALVPPPGAPAAWITEQVVPEPKNFYGVTKLAAENLCKLVHREQGLPCLILRTSRFFPEEDDNKSIREAFEPDNAKANEFLHRRADIEDIVNAHLLAAKRAPAIGFGTYIISATTPFSQSDLPEIRSNPAAVVAQHIPGFTAAYERLAWRMFPSLDRVYVNRRAREELGWHPKFDFAHIIDQLANGQPIGSDLARSVGAKGYHAQSFSEGPYPVTG